MTGDHHGRTAGRATLLVTATDEVRGWTPAGSPLAAEQAQGAGLADRLFPAVHAEPTIQAFRPLLGGRPGDAQLARDNRERQWGGQVPENLGLRHGDRRRPELFLGFGGRLVGGGGDEAGFGQRRDRPVGGRPFPPLRGEPWPPRG